MVCRCSQGPLQCRLVPRLPSLRHQGQARRLVSCYGFFRRKSLVSRLSKSSSAIGRHLLRGVDGQLWQGIWRSKYAWISDFLRCSALVMYAVSLRFFLLDARCQQLRPELKGGEQCSRTRNWAYGGSITTSVHYNRIPCFPAEHYTLPQANVTCALGRQVRSSSSTRK